MPCDCVPHNYETLKWLSSLPTLMQKSFWWWPCSDRYIISLSPHLRTPFSPSLISLMVSVNVKHHVYLLDHCQNNYVQTSRSAQVLTADSMVLQPSCRASPPGTRILVPGCAVKRLNQLVTSSRNVYVLAIMCQLSYHVGRSYQVESVPLLRAGRSKSHMFMYHEGRCTI